MSKIGLFYGSSGGNTEDVATALKTELEKQGAEVELHDIATDDYTRMRDFDRLILATSTWNEGELQDDWHSVYDDLQQMDFSGKTVAFVGLGDQDNYGDHFANGMGLLSKPFATNGARIVGRWPTEGYNFEASEAVEGDKFVGLALDVDNQLELNDERMQRWSEQVTKEFGIE